MFLSQQYSNKFSFQPCARFLSSRWWIREIRKLREIIFLLLVWREWDVNWLCNTIRIMKHVNVTTKIVTTWVVLTAIVLCSLICYLFNYGQIQKYDKSSIKTIILVKWKHYKNTTAVQLLNIQCLNQVRYSLYFY